MAILRQPIAKQAMAIWRSPIAKKVKVIWVIFIAQFMLATWRRTIAKYSRAYTIAKQAMPFGDHSSLKSESNFSTILVLNMLATWR